MVSGWRSALWRCVSQARPGRKETWTRARPPLNFTRRPARPAMNRRKAFPRPNGFSGSRLFYASTIPPALNQPLFSPPIWRHRGNRRPVVALPSRPAKRGLPNQRRARLRRTYQGLPQTYQMYRHPRLRWAAWSSQTAGPRQRHRTRDRGRRKLRPHPLHRISRHQFRSTIEPDEATILEGAADRSEYRQAAGARVASEVFKFFQRPCA